MLTFLPVCRQLNVIVNCKLFWLLRRRTWVRFPPRMPFFLSDKRSAKSILVFPSFLSTRGRRLGERMNVLLTKLQWSAKSILLALLKIVSIWRSLCQVSKCIYSFLCNEEIHGLLVRYVVDSNLCNSFGCITEIGVKRGFPGLVKKEGFSCSRNV